MPGKKGKTSQIPDDFGEISPKETATSGSTSGPATGVLLAMRTAAAAASAADAAKAKTLTEQEIKQRYDNSINAATPDLPGEYTGVTLENSSSTTDTEDILRGHLAKLKQADIRKNTDFPKRNISIQELIRHNKTGAKVQLTSLHNRWRIQFNRIITKIREYITNPNPRPIGVIEPISTYDTLRERCKNRNCLLYKFSINGYNFHLTFHNIYDSEEQTGIAGAFHIAYDETDSKIHHIYRFVPYINSAEPRIIKLKSFLLHRGNRIIQGFPNELRNHIQNISSIVETKFTYTLNPTASNPLRTLLKGGSKRTVRRNRSKRRTTTAKLLRR